MDFMEGIGYKLLDYQHQIINNVINNINDGNRMQTILLPNGGGKTTLSYILSIMFTRTGKRVLYFNNSTSFNEKSYAAQAIRTNLANFATIDFADAKNIKKFLNNKYDIVITDSITACFDEEVLSDFNDIIRNLNVDFIEKNYETCSLSQTALIGLYYLRQLIETNNSYVISFELNNMEDIGYAPIIATPHVISFKMTREELNEYEYACTNAYEQVVQKKISAILDKNLSRKEITKFDSAESIILEKISVLEDKIDNLQNDVSKILSVVIDLNTAVNDNKKILELYFSIHDTDSDESDLFITKMVEKMTLDLSQKLAEFDNQEKYQKILKLVKLKLGENAWGKLSSESKKFLVTAKLMFVQNLNLGEDIDYSGICLLSSKALEVELAKRLIDEYKQYLNSNNISISKWPKALLVYDKKNNDFKPIEKEDFTLGSCPYIMGFLGRESERKENWKYFEMYSKEKLMKSIPHSKISSTIKEINEYVRYIKENYRNPAAHKSTVTMIEASECLDYILEIEQALKIMLEYFEY